MKTIDNIFEKFVDINNLRDAYYSSRKGKSMKHYVLSFEKQNQDDCLLYSLQKQLADGSFMPSEHTYFEIFDTKPRTIAKLPYYPDRIVQHALINVLREYWENFILGKNTYACVRDRGVLGKNGLYHDLKSIMFQKHPRYCLKIDVRRYYNNISHRILKSMLKEQIKDIKILDVLFKYIDNYNSGIEGKGLPIGSILSQYISNVYLTHFDYYVKKRYRDNGVYYFRYNDDMVFVGDDKQQLHKVLQDVIIRLQDYELTLSRRQVFPIAARGIDVGGFVFYNTHVLLRRRIKKRIYRVYNKNSDSKNINRTFAGWKGYVLHSDCRHFLRRTGMSERYINILKHRKIYS